MSTAQQLPPNVQPFRAPPAQLAQIEDETLDLRRITATLRRRKIMIAAIGLALIFGLKVFAQDTFLLR